MLIDENLLVELIHCRVCTAVVIGDLLQPNRPFPPFRQCSGTISVIRVCPYTLLYVHALRGHFDKWLVYGAVTEDVYGEILPHKRKCVSLCLCVGVFVHRRVQCSGHLIADQWSGA